MTWSKAISEFLSYLKVEKRYSENTIVSYKRQLAAITEYCKTIACDSPAELSQTQVQKMMAEFHRTGLGPRTIQLRLSALRGLYKHLNKNIEVKDPTDDIQTPKTNKQLPGVMDVDEINLLASQTQNSELEMRDQAMVELFYASGIRLSELQQLNLKEIDFKELMIRVSGKGSKTRVLPFGEHAHQAIKKWLEYRKLKPCVDDALFVNQQGQRLSRRTIQRRLEQLGVKTGQTQRVHPHKLRHAFASHMLESCNDLRVVQELLGHANISTTQVYTHLNFQQLAKVIDEAHPRAKRKKNKADK